jgi:adenylate kinase
MNLILFGAPGSGKGTQAQVLSEKLRLEKISLGDIFREEVKNGSSLGKEVRQYMEKGLLVPDDLVSRVIEAHINHKDFVLDGYPRNVSQANTLEEILKKKKLDIDWFIYLEVDDKTITERLSQRRICKKCGANYHLKNMPPRKANVCDKCNSALTQRKDDMPLVIKKRCDVFLKETKEVLDFYKNKKKLITIDARADKDEVFARIKEILP